MARTPFRITKLAVTGEVLIHVPTSGWRFVPQKVKASNQAGSATDVRVYFGIGNSLDENKVFASGKVGDSSKIDCDIGTSTTSVKGAADEKIYSKGLSANQAYNIEVSGYMEEIT